MDIHCRCLPDPESNTAVVQAMDNWEMPVKILLDSLCSQLISITHPDFYVPPTRMGETESPDRRRNQVRSI